MDFNNLFDRISDEVFWEIVNNESRKLRLHNSEWNKYNNICSRTMRNNKIQKVLEENIPTEFTKKDSKDLIKYHNADIERQVIENRALFKAGFRFAYFLLNKMEMIEIDESDLRA